MEAIYWVLNWACHRRCRHCYDDRFRPYVRGALEKVIGESVGAFPRIIDNLPEDMSYRDAKGRRQRTKIVLAGGELLLDGVRERVFYPVLERIAARYGAAAPALSMQTTGDVLTPRFIEEMLARNVTTIAIASIDDFHAGHQGEGKFALMDRVRAMMAPFGVQEIAMRSADESRLRSPDARTERGPGPAFLFFGAQPDLWIGELWPRGRAWTNGLSNADYDTNFCARWSGGRNFLNHGQAGSEVAIEPDGSVYPCCLKTKAPLGNLTEERLIDILDSLKDHPAFMAINEGDPEAMGEAFAWRREDFRAASEAVTPGGKTMRNPCIGCDDFFARKLGADLANIRAARLARRAHA